MSRRKQSRPRHVDNDGLGLGPEVEPGPPNGGMLLEGATREEDEKDTPTAPMKRSGSGNENDDGDNDKIDGVENTEEFCPSGEVASPDGCDNVSACDKCGVCFTDVAQFIAHKKLCGSRSRILMPYDPPVNGYLQNGYDFGRSSLDGSLSKDYSDGEDRDDRDDYESLDEEDRSRNDTSEFDTSDVLGKRKRGQDNDDMDNEEDPRYRPQIRSDESFILGLRNRMTASMQNLRDRRIDGGDDGVDKNERLKDDEEDEEEYRRKRLKASSEDESASPSRPGKTADPAIAWALKAAERGLFGGNSNVTLEPLAATSAAVAQSGDNLSTRESVPEEVNMFRTMLFQLQQQQLMQIQMIQQMRRQLIASGVNPSMLPADVDLNMMSSESLASVGAAMSGLQNAAVAVAARDSGKPMSSGAYNGASRSPSHGGRSRDSSPSLSESSHRGTERPSSPVQGKSLERDLDRQQEGGKLREERTSAGVDISDKYLSPIKPVLDSPFSKDLVTSSPLTKNPLEILQEKTAASLSSLPLPPGLRSSASTDSKPPSSSSSLLNSNALFASSPSLSALQKETDALKPSPILPPISIPMTPEDYKGYIQRGTILERSQYASDDPFFKHKCRFCHKVFGSDSALQIHVRSHTGERPFKCNICGNRFSTKGNLKVHFERHKAKYPHIKMDSTPVPEHLDRQPNMMPNFPPTPIPPSVPLPPPMPRLPIPSAPHGPPPSPSSMSSHVPSSHPSPFPPGFGGTFVSSVGPGLSPFGLMPPPRDGPMPFPYPLSLSLPSSKPMPLSLGRDSMAMARRESPKLTSGSAETSVIRSPLKESPTSSSRDISPSDSRRYTPQHHLHSQQPHHPYSHHDPQPRHPAELSDSYRSDDNGDPREERDEKRHVESDRQRSRSRHDSEESRSQSPISRRSGAASVSTPATNPSSPSLSLPRPSSSHSPRQSPASVISWASLASTQSPMLSGPHPMFPPHLHPGFPGLSLPLPGNPSAFPLPSPLNPVLPMSGPRVSGHSPFLPPPPPPPPPPQISPPPGDGSMFRNSILPTKTIDPSENLEQYMEVQKSETSKLEALVKNIEQKITDPNQCVVCHRVLSCKSALQMHYRIHTGERPFKCKICGRSFTTKGNLKTHMGVHRAKPALRMMHQCPVCHKQFTNVLVLQQHIRAHTGTMQHMPHMSMLPSHMDWAHRPPFGHHPYLPPMHADSQSLDLSRGPAFHHSHFSRGRSHSVDGDHQRGPMSPKKDSHVRQDESISKREKEKDGDDEALKDEETSRPHSRNSEGCDDKDRLTSSPSEAPREDRSGEKLSFRKSEYDSAFLPPAFGATPFDAPLAALEERVKAIDSQSAQTSFEKFRNSMGLDSAFYPNSMPNMTLSNGEKNSEQGSEPASKPESPASGGDIPPYGFPMMGGFPNRYTTTCNICLKTFACKSALDIHYRSHTKDKPFLCDVCDRSFSTKGNLKQHLLTHKIRDLPSSAFNDDGDGEPNADDDLLKKGEDEDIDDDELPNEDYPFEEDDCLEEPGLDPEIDPDDDTDNLTDEFNEPPPSDEPPATPKSQDDSHEDKNNNFQDQEDDDNADQCTENAENESKENTSQKSESPRNSSLNNKLGSSPDPETSSNPKEKSDGSAMNNPSTASGHRINTSGSSSSSGHQNSSSPAARRSTGPKHQCMTCMKPFSSASALQIHTRTHTGDKPFKCTVCSKAFTTRGNLKVHMGTHMWNNSPSRRGRRMSIEPPFLLSHMKDNPFMPTGFPPRPPPDFFYQYPLPMMNGPGSKMNEISVIQSLSGALPTLPPIPPHLMHGFLPKDDAKLSKDPTRPTSESGDTRDQHSDKKPSSGELDLSVKVSGRDTSPPPPRSASSTPSSSLSLSVHSVASAMSTPASSMPSPSNNKENSSSSALDLRDMRAAPWLWGTFPCHHCGQMFPLQDSLEHHLRTHHLGKSEPAAHSLSKSDSHPPPPPKALLA